jgi:O-antigen ligase
MSLFVLGILSTFTPLVAFMIMLIVAPMRTLIATESSYQLPLDLGQIAFILLLTAWIIGRIIQKQRLFDLEWSPVHVPVIALAVIFGVTAFSATSLGAWIREWLKWFQILVLMTLVLNVAKQRRSEWLVFGLIISGTANALVGLYQFLGGSGALHLLIDDRFFRAFGTFGQPNPFGGFMGLLAPLALMSTLALGVRVWKMWKTTRRGAARMIIFASVYAIMSLLIVTGVFISWSRGAWLGFTASLLVMLVLLPKKVWKAATLLVLVSGVTGMLWVTGRIPASIVIRVSSAAEEFVAFDDVRGIDITPDNYAVMERLAHWQAATNMAQANPWIGVGAGNYEMVYEDYRLINWHEPLGHAHNYYLNVMAEAGIMGLLGYGLSWVIIVWLTWRVRQHPDTTSRLTGIGLLGTWTYLAVHSLTDNLYVNNMFLHLGVMLGILAVLYNQTWKSVRLRTL